MNVRKTVLRALFALALTASLWLPAMAQQSGSDANGGSQANMPQSSQDNSQVSSQGSQSNASGSSLDAKDRRFIEKLAAGNEAEIQLGQLAQQKAQNQQVKDFAQRMVNDHTNAKNQMQQILSKDNINAPSQPDPKEQAEMQRLQSLSGSQFDKAYMQHMVQDHRKDVAEVQRASQTAKNPDVKQLASQLLPTLQSHLQQAQQIASQVGASSGNQTSTNTSSSQPQK
jgi:putative membrane protein